MAKTAIFPPHMMGFDLDNAVKSCQQSV